MEALLLFVAQFTMRTQHDLQVASEVFLTKEVGDASNALPFFAGNLQERRILARNLGDGRVAQKTYGLTGEMCGAVSFADEMVNLTENLFAVRVRHGLHDLFQDMSRGRADESANRISRQLIGGR